MDFMGIKRRLILRRFQKNKFTLEKMHLKNTAVNFLTINVPLFLKVRDFMFFRREKHIISHFDGFF
jgi:hypothetical protein